MAIMIEASAYERVWRRYERYCNKKKLNPYSDIARALWTHDKLIPVDGEAARVIDLDIIDEILNTAKRTG